MRLAAIRVEAGDVYHIGRDTSEALILLLRRLHGHLRLDLGDLLLRYILVRWGQVHLRHLVHGLLLRWHHGLLRHHRLLLNRCGLVAGHGVVSRTAETTGRTAGRRTTIAAWWGLTGTTHVKVHWCGCITLGHVLRDSINSTETRRHGDSLADTVSIDST